MQSNPIVVDGVLYATTPTMKVVAVNAESGRRSGSSIRAAARRARTRFRHRGVAVHADRVFVTYRNFLFALDKTTGPPIAVVRLEWARSICARASASRPRA